MITRKLFLIGCLFSSNDIVIHVCGFLRTDSITSPVRRNSAVLRARLRRPIRPASIEKKVAERKAIVQSRQNEALQDPTLLTNLSFLECESLHASTKRALVEDMGLQSMTEVQAKTFSAALAGKDVLGRARTGTGKTLAFLIPTVERILKSPSFLPGKRIGCLVVAPTRELAIQIGEETEKLLAYHSDLTVLVMYGGTKMARDVNAMNRLLPAILVATPGRLLDHLRGTKVRGRKFGDDIISNTEILVLDEIDRLLDMGFRNEIQNVVNYLPRKEKRQTLLFSATIPKGLKKIMEENMRDEYLEVDCIEDGTTSSPTNLRVTQSHIILSEMAEIIPSIYSILKESTKSSPHKIVVFLPTARMVSFFAAFFNEGFESPIIDLHSKKSQSSRNTASDNFRRAKNAILFTSDLSARGVDYPDVTQVIQIGLPESREQYIHRLGRTARAGKKGNGLLVLFPFECTFLAELKGLEVPVDESLSEMLKHSSSKLPEWIEQNFARIRNDGNKLATCAQLAYLSFLGYYVDQIKRIKVTSTAEVVTSCNEFCSAIGLARIPQIPRRLISKMNLEGVQGIVAEDEE